MKRTLKGIRVDLGYTIEDMAKAMGVSKTTWLKKEHGQVSLLATELVRISELSKVPMTDIEILK